ncbi:MFS transporter [Streptomyces sp. NPDC096311]|uniref:MFS transporter n=1 Tax=Streptomyces sp. NPDC096311 TaxID=3366083 RepID=UPI00380D3ED5
MSASLDQQSTINPDSRVRSPGRAIAVLASCGLLVSLVQTMVVPLLPAFPRLMSVSTSTAAWLVTATLVSGAVSAPVFGRLGDMYGKRRMLLISIGLILVGSVLGAIAPNILVLLIGRTLQGVSFGVVALGMSLMRDILPEERIGSAVGMMSASVGAGGAIGLPIAGAVSEWTDWRWLFAGAAVVAMLQIVLVRRLVAESPLRSGGRFDGAGAAGLGGILVCLLLGISKGADWGWLSPTVILLFVGAALMFAIWMNWELRAASPIVDLRVSARPAVLRTNLATVLIGFSMFATFVLATQILQAPVVTGYGFGLSLIVSGLALLPLGGCMVVFSSTSARMSRIYGPRLTLVFGTGLMAVGNIGFALLPGSVWILVAVATVGAIGGALAYSALPLLIMSAVPVTETAAANSLNTLMRQLGNSTCTSVAAAVTSALVVDAHGASFPSGTAYSVVFTIAAVTAVGALAVGLLTPARRDDGGSL